MAGIEHIVATPFDDRIVGDSQANSLWGNLGSDTIVGGAGNDSLGGYAGRFTGGEGDDDINLEPVDAIATAVFSGPLTDYTVTLRGNLGMPILIRDTVPGRDGADQVRGMDFYEFADGTVTLHELLSTLGNTVRGTEGPDRLYGQAEPYDGQYADRIYGFGGADDLDGLSGNDFLFGGDGNDYLGGGDGNDRLHGGSGLDVHAGGDGVDTAVFEKPRHSYVVTRTDSWWVRETGTPGEGDKVYYTTTERLEFEDVGFAFDLDGEAGAAARLIGAIVGAAGVGNAALAATALRLLGGGMDEAALAALGMDAFFAGSSDDQVVDALYTNVVGAMPDASTRSSFTTMLADGTQTWGSLALLAASTDLAAGRIDLARLSVEGLAYMPWM